MTPTLKIVRRVDRGGDISELDLYQYADGIAASEWVPEIGGLYDATVDEALTLIIKGSSHSDLASKIRVLDTKMSEIMWSHDESQQYDVFIRHKLDGETVTRQALLFDIKGTPRSHGWMGPPTTPGSHIADYVLGLTRAALWENTAYESFSVSGVGIGGGTAVVGNPSGTAPSRIARMMIGDTAAANALTEFWIGFYSNRSGVPSYYDAVWYCGNATTSSADTSLAAGGAATCDFGSETDMAERIVIQSQDAFGGNMNKAGAVRGEFQVLLRAYVSAGTVCDVRMGHGCWTVHTPLWNTYQRVRVESTVPHLYNLGTVQFPATRASNTATWLAQHGFRLEAKRVSGSGSLVMSRFILIPRTEGFVHIKNASCSSSGQYLRVYTQPNGRVDGWDSVGGNIVLEPHRFELPQEYGYVVVAAQPETATHSTSDTVGIAIEAYPRYRSLSS